MIEVMNWGGGVQPNGTACQCGCTCVCGCLCSCVEPQDPYQFGDANNEASLHCHNTQLTSDANAVHEAVKRGWTP